MKIINVSLLSPYFAWGCAPCGGQAKDSRGMAGGDTTVLGVITDPFGGGTLPPPFEPLGRGACNPACPFAVE